MVNRDESTRLFVERLTRAAEAEGPRARAREWRGRSERERSEVFAQLLFMTHEMLKARPTPYVKERFDFPRFSSRAK